MSDQVLRGGGAELAGLRVRRADEPALGVLEVHLVWRRLQERGQQLALLRKCGLDAFALRDVLDLSDPDRVGAILSRGGRQRHERADLAAVASPIAPLVLSARVTQELAPEPQQLGRRIVGLDEIDEQTSLERRLRVTEHLAERRVDHHQAAVGIDEHDSDRCVGDDPFEPAVLIVKLCPRAGERLRGDLVAVRSQEQEQYDERGQQHRLATRAGTVRENQRAEREQREEEQDARAPCRGQHHCRKPKHPPW